MALLFGGCGLSIGAWYQREILKRERAEKHSRMNKYWHWIEEASLCMRKALHLYYLMKDKECNESMDTVSCDLNPFVRVVGLRKNRASIREEVLGETVFAQISRDKEEASEVSVGWSKSLSVSIAKHYQKQEELYWGQWDSSCRNILTDIELSDGYLFYMRRIQDIENFEE